MLPDICAYQVLDTAGKVAWTRRTHFVGTVQHTLSGANLVRIEEVEFARSTQVGKGVFLTKLVVALQGVQDAAEFPAKLGNPLAVRYSGKLADAYEWYATDRKGTKSRLLRQDIDSSGHAVAVYENGIVLEIGQLLKTVRNSIALQAK